MKKMRIILCIYGLFASFALGLHGDESDVNKDIERNEWKMFLEDVPEAESAMQYILFINVHATNWGQRKMLNLAQEKIEPADKLRVSFKNVIDLLNSNPDDSNQNKELLEAIYAGAEEGRQSGYEEAREDMTDLRLARGSRLTRVAFSKVETELNKKMDFIKEFEHKYQSILNLEDAPSFSEEIPYN